VKLFSDEIFHLKMFSVKVCLLSTIKQTKVGWIELTNASKVIEICGYVLEGNTSEKIHGSYIWGYIEVIQTSSWLKGSYQSWGK